MPKKKKHPIFRPHKIIIHPNRWLIYAIVYAVIVAIAMVGYISISEVTFESQVAENHFVPWHNFNDLNLGFRLRIPADWALEADGSSMISFVPTSSSDEGVSVAVVQPSDETAIRKDLNISEETKITLDGNPAVRIVNNLGNNHFETVIMAIHNQRLYVLRGTDLLVQEMQLTFHFE